ncbi:hypothetical protein [Helicovermis profundi]|uniref:Uncharacterized protein n=1 Tax=Helicovermis profundi TaxID=3065157 RepID=A0AAU9EGH0_9FIRM|nr:hypothetical protein HLPR_08340 [Clostridia bacterium S502]
MYQIKKENYGFKLVFEGMIHKEEMEKWRDESKKILSSASKDFGNVIDLRKMSAIKADTQSVMEEGQKLYKESGMKRSAVVLDSAITTMQFKRIAKTTGIDKFERYIDASTHSNWEELAVKWVKEGIDTDI